MPLMSYYRKVASFLAGLNWYEGGNRIKLILQALLTVYITGRFLAEQFTKVGVLFLFILLGCLVIEGIFRGLVWLIRGFR